MAGFAVLDFETTGLVPERTDRVVEVGVVLLDADGRREESWTTLVNPRRDIGATHIHGISAQHVLDAPEFPDISDQLLSLVSGRTLVAHNAAFDMRFLHQELLRAGYGITDRPDALCSMKWSKRLLGAAKLQHCCEALGIPLANAHSALGDAEATSELLTHLLQLGGAQRAWQDDVSLSSSYAWPNQFGRRAARTITRTADEPAMPGSWMASLLARAWVPDATEDESAYLATLENALLDSDISVTEGRALVEIAAAAGVTPERMLELHRAHLGSLAAEAWSDGVLTDTELAEFGSAAAAMGLSPSDAIAALDAHRETRSSPTTTLLQPGDRVVFTGELVRPRDQWIAEIVSAGLSTGGLTKTTRVVVAADPDSLSGKAAKARNYGVPIVTEESFARHFESYGDANQ